MTFSPKLRSTLTAIVAVLATVAALLPTFTEVPPVVGSVIAGILAVAAALGIVPPQTGGTQVGVKSPSIVEPPQADVVEQPPLGGGL